MPKKKPAVIVCTIQVPVSYMLKLAKSNYVTFNGGRKAAEEYMATPEFAKKLSKELLNAWTELNDDTSDMQGVLDDLFGDLIKYDE
jgi:hypothetical protein